MKVVKSRLPKFRSLKMLSTAIHASPVGMRVILDQKPPCGHISLVVIRFICASHVWTNPLDVFWDAPHQQKFDAIHKLWRLLLQISLILLAKISVLGGYLNFHDWSRRSRALELHLLWGQIFDFSRVSAALESTRDASQTRVLQLLLILVFASFRDTS